MEGEHSVRTFERGRDLKAGGSLLECMVCALLGDFIMKAGLRRLPQPCDPGRHSRLYLGEMTGHTFKGKVLRTSRVYPAA